MNGHWSLVIGHWLLGVLGVLCGGVFAAEPPKQPNPLGITPSAKQVELGRDLFHDPRLSEDGTVSCSSCHDPRFGWADGRKLAIGIRGQAGPFHTPSIINAGYSAFMFWDGRTIGTPTQSLLPLSNPIEMGNQTEEQVLIKLRLIPGYVKKFTEAFEIDPIALSAITGRNLAIAFAAFESGITSFDAPIDRFLDGDTRALSPEAQIGYRIALAARCTECHTPPLWTDNLFHNNGSEWAGKVRPTEQGRYAVVPRGLRTGDMLRAFKTASWRELARTAPYMHHGFFESLDRVVLHYDLGGMKHDGTRDRYQDPRIRPLGLTASQRKYLVIFLAEMGRGSNYPMTLAPRRLP
jgi:cytochrome c peroxidase